MDIQKQPYQINRKKFMGPEEIERLLKLCDEKAIVDMAKGRTTWVTRYMLVHLALRSGLRVSEIASLKIEDLKLTGRDNYLVVTGKRGKRRDVYLDHDLVRHLKNYINLKKKAWGQTTDRVAPLLTGRGGGHYTTTALQISFKKAAAEAGLPGHYSIHSCRHSYATMLLAKTNNLRFVQKQLGHASLTMTALYADVLPEMNQALANSILE